MNSFCFFNTVDEWGGGERWHFDVASYLQQKGHRVVIITRPGAELGARAEKSGIEVVYISIKNLSVFNPWVISKIVRVFRSYNTDTVVMNLSRDLKCGGIAAKIAGVPRIVFRRGSDRTVRNYFVNRYLYQKVVTGILTNSQATKNAILAHGESLVNPRKIKVIPNGIDTHRFLETKYRPVLEKKNAPFVLGALGRLEPQKNFEFLIAVAQELRDRGISFHLLIGGKGSQEQLLRAKMEECNLSEQIYLLGFLDNPKELLMSCDVFLLPSLWEGFGYVIVEASLSELPVVAFDVSSNGEVVTKDTGFLTLPGAVSDFCDKIEYLYRHPRVCKSMGKAGKAFVMKNFESALIFEKIENYLVEGSKF